MQKSLSITILLLISLMLASPSNATSMENMDHSTMPKLVVQTIKGSGIIKGIKEKEGIIILAHQPIKELNWPAMTMGFKVAHRSLLKGLEIGHQVAFELQAEGTSMPTTVSAIKPVR
ncbi:copper-binding protein [Iodobacter fluviatilis]|uniref:Cation efflux system protein CusF n=1 Tax=Iodobacter fluviatilis TaxID=537 RepID=A0A377QB49_9NEIS|nr:copper-binding protein [Iodobacter fluviatilis]TCU81411.1 Cu(I)/Ag(I) efflux system protein CusF [Iodobacter fluviatilis]STQ91945.1 Cation efflux system protein CusF precursor [Iodobacter fluviatilis]